MTTKNNIPHLLDEPPISVYPSLAKALGNVNKAIILQQLHFLLNAARLSNNRYVEVDGKWWVYNSYKQWREDHFTWLAEVTIKGLFGMLEHDGLVISRQGVKDAFDRRKWYTIDYKAYMAYISSIGQKVSDVHEIKNISWEGQNLSDDNRKSETPYSETPIQRINTLSPEGDGASELKPISVVQIPSKEKKKKEKPVDPDGGAIAALIHAWLTASGTINPRAYVNSTLREQARALHKQGISPADVTRYIEDKRLDKFWETKEIKLSKVAAEIVAFLHKTGATKDDDNRYITGKYADFIEH